MFRIYSSSAGSGKTYTLTKEYIKLALHPENDSYFRHILAVTFTNAAAREMKERILGTLKAFSAGTRPQMMLDIVSELFPATATDPELREQELIRLQERAGRIFTRILHGYSDFSVMTIDSFISRLVGSFTDELGLPFGFETRLDGDLLTEAIDRLLSRIGLTGEESLTRILESYYLEHARDEGGWGALPKQMLAAASDLLNEESYLAMTRVSDLTLSDWQQIRKQLLATIQEKESLIREHAGKGYDAITNAGLTASDFFQSSRGIYGYMASRTDRNAAKLWEMPNSYVIKTVSEDKWYAGKIPVATQHAIDSAVPVLKDSYSSIEEIRSSFGGHAFLYKALAGQLYSLSLLNEIKREFDRLLRQNNQVHISEFNRRIIDIVACDPIPFIFERLGEKYNHILIDEFQDTSRLQFANLLPLIENALSGGFFNLIVGDVKQAIYRFRGGDMELLLRLSNMQAERITEIFENAGPFTADRLRLVGRSSGLVRLSSNRRSYKEITTFNNDFFRFLSVSGDTGGLLTREVYDQYFQQETGSFTPEGGHVQIDFFEKTGADAGAEDSADTGPEALLPDWQGARVISQIRELREEGYAWRDIAILCRYKKNSAQLAVWLQQADVPLISDDSLLLSNSAYVKLIIQLIKVIQAPDSTGLKLEAAISLHRTALHKVIDGAAMNELAAMSRTPGLASFLAYLTRLGIDFSISEIYQLSIYELCERITSKAGLLDNPSESQYIFRFLDEVLQFENTRVSHPADFLAWWDMTGKSISITASADTDAVRITTIHKSKGLEYPVVIFPYADWAAAPKAGSRLWVSLRDIEQPELSSHGKRLVSAAVPMTRKLEETPVGAQYREEVERVLLENINLTYVAFTRPVQRLYILAWLPAELSEGNSSPAPAVNRWLKTYLVHIGEWNPDRTQYILAENNSAPAHQHVKSTGTQFVLSSLSGSKEAATLGLKKNADKVFDTDTFAKDRDLHRKMRQILIQAPSSAQFDETVAKAVQSGLLRPEDRNSVIEKSGWLFKNHLVAGAFSQESLRLPPQIILKGGRIIEADRLVKAGNGMHYVLVFSAQTPAGEDRMKSLLRNCYACGIAEAEGLLIDLETETVRHYAGAEHGQVPDRP